MMAAQNKLYDAQKHTQKQFKNRYTKNKIHAMYTIIKTVT